MKKSIMRKYAKLAVQKGVNLQKGQGTVIRASVSEHEFAEMVAEEAYRAGAKWVRIDWNDQAVTKLAYRHETVTQLSRVEDWEVEKAKHSVKELPCMIAIASADPDGMKGVNPVKLQKSMIAQSKVFKPIQDEMENKYQWTIVAVPSKAWAKKVFPGERTSTAVEKLWGEILKAVRITEDNDPVAEWNRHNETLREKCQALNALNLDYLHYKSSNGTDFTCWLIPGGKWCGGSDTLKTTGVEYNPNMPSEEVFTSPLRGKCEGTVVSTLPLSYQGTVINQFSMDFQNGRAVAVHAPEHQELLEKMISMDEGAAMLGELALVPHDSPISNSGVLFYNTLFDENAACHIAMGRGFNETVEGAENMSDEELRETGVNDSFIHVDFMIGCKDLNITGHTRDGKEVAIFQDGNWAI
ncbi:aminopeptidase [Acutalibacter sp. 1XD8-33]|uniref:aminopeptidase n=1 Tax=Acutalibacter sp. 1XD8-33 TaxID=2320081 RepID=UPI000EA35046|nr:aminopeptidase [Acutalibacter sp. 1XD8-33]RKJ39414.1 aminopeptidase [Acutalibacter sp. 1XD8-33]